MDKILVRGINTLYKVGAVVDLPPNTQLSFDILGFVSKGPDSGQHYIMLCDGEEMTPQLEEQLANFLPPNDNEKKRESWYKHLVMFT